MNIERRIWDYNRPEKVVVYKKFKEDYIKKLASKYKDELDSRVYEALVNYQVEITD